jgi:hypothetical protein
MKIIRHRDTKTSVLFQRMFDYVDQPGSGFWFPCDEQGQVDVDQLHPCARESYQGCLSGAVDGKPMADKGVRKIENTYHEPAIGECVCGAEVVLDGFTCTCHGCGRDYNSAGQLLAPREQWGEETGESVADILAADTDRWED